MSSPKILALDCSTEYCSVALRVGDAVIAKDERAGQRHSELLLPMIDTILAEGDVKLKDLNAIAFGAGPGSFTGLRIACGVAQGLAFGANVPVVPIPTLLALAQATDATRVLAILDARMGEIYFAAYERVDAIWQTRIAPCLCKPEAAPLVAEGLWMGVGSGFAAYGDALQQRFVGRVGSIDGTRYPHAIQIAQLAADRLGEAVSPEFALPLYIRNKVALTEIERGVVR
jgi:tRNA threonylcarbamoyladenosine biosynthesis protein TsaB